MRITDRVTGRWRETEAAGLGESEIVCERDGPEEGKIFRLRKERETLRNWKKVIGIKIKIDRKRE